MTPLIIKNIGSNTKLGVVDTDTRRVLFGSWDREECEQFLQCMLDRDAARDQQWEQAMREELRGHFTDAGVDEAVAACRERVQKGGE